jgi:hypothetical protein
VQAFYIDSVDEYVRRKRRKAVFCMCAMVLLFNQETIVWALALTCVLQPRVMFAGSC